MKRRRVAIAAAVAVALLAASGCSTDSEPLAGSRVLPATAQGDAEVQSQIVLVRQESLEPVCGADLLSPAESGSAFEAAERALVAADDVAFGEQVASLRQQLRGAESATPEDLARLASTARAVLAASGGTGESDCLGELDTIITRLEELGFVDDPVGSIVERARDTPADLFARTFGVTGPVAECASGIYDSQLGVNETVDELLALQAIAQCQQ